uniref:Uncharacterized protein n=1 Tax=Anopheles merus TaxID=30066 RepID=A0A182VME7_ANOME
MSIIESSASANTQTSSSLAQVFSTKSMIAFTCDSGSKHPKIPSIRNQFARISTSSHPVTPFNISCKSFSVICWNSSGLLRKCSSAARISDVDASSSFSLRSPWNTC